MKKVHRIDYMPFPDEGPDGSWMVKKMELTDEGYLTGRAIATNVGVFPYIMDDGRVQYELRAPEEVFHPDSVKTLEKVIVTNNHPTVLVTAENSKELGVGFTGDVRQDQYHLAPSITITDKDAVQDVNDGKRGLSCGYTADTIMESGNWMGISYDAKQVNIRYNHLAIVPKGRAGDAAKLKLDSMDSIGVLKIDEKPKKESAKMPKIKLDNGVEYEVDSAVYTAYNDQAKELGTVKADSEKALNSVNTELSTVKAKNDQLEEENTKLKTDMEELKQNQVDSTKVDEMVKERMDLLKSAEKAGVEIKEDMTPADIQKAVVLAVFPGAKEKLDSCDDVYLKARFDGAVETLENSDGYNGFRNDSLEYINNNKQENNNSNQRQDDTDDDYGRGAMINNMNKGGN